MAQVKKFQGYYWNFRAVATITGNSEMEFDTNNGVYLTYEVNSNRTGSPADNKLVIANQADETIKQIKVGDSVRIDSGCPDLFCKISSGTITRVSNDKDGKDKLCTIEFHEGVDYGQAPKVYSSFNGKKTITTKKGGKKVKKTAAKHVNKNWGKNTGAKTIINWIASTAGFKIGRLKLASEKKYKKGYTLSQKPYAAIKALVADCKSIIYMRNGEIIIDDNKKPNPFNEHLYLDLGCGLLNAPSSDDESDKGNRWNLTCLDDGRIMAGSAVYVAPLNQLCVVDTAQHLKSSDGYTMQLSVVGAK